MNNYSERLSEFFVGIGYKRVSAVEADPKISNQHEFNGVNKFRELFGSEREEIKATVYYLSDFEEEELIEDVKLTWYDSRKNHLTRTEYRLYYPAAALSFKKMSLGDLLVLCKKQEGDILLIIAQANSIYENQIKYLFEIEEEVEPDKFVVKKIEESELSFASAVIMEKLGIYLVRENKLELLLEKFGGEFPNTAEFSTFARSLVECVNPTEDPDEALIRYFDEENRLFNTLEKHIIENKVKKGFESVKEFIDTALTVLNKRKSRAGHALEHHLSYIFEQNKIRFSRNKITENRSKPDFVFPGISQYHDGSFPNDSLTMLGVKTTCKDRWRQVLSEAAKIEKKHLLTLQPAITEPQTQEMRSSRLQLVVPEKIRQTYNTRQQGWVLNLSEFTKIILSRQNR